MTKPEGHYADAATEREAEEKKMLEEFQVWFRTVKHCVGDRKMQLEIFCHGYRVACASKQKEIAAIREANITFATASIAPAEVYSPWAVVINKGE